MRFFELLGFQHVMLYLFPTLIFIIVFALLLAYSHLRGRNAEARKSEIVERFADDIEGREAPFPLGMALIIAGTLIWELLYIWFTGALGVKI
ncbi:hypothetical protein DENIS_0724 [Desulfonema ishimotonii]|uniref:Uncharacterized protein n=1 Tax=Desulfonema ishimotonii TaxID=45657 RepID=A0A401FS58_9BACT|nr:hypothetical protein [Desulfonema ishimotonii]GBC59783.1 hypothetical protein DENIS_0724 [Desulfonema ishimotonii]